MNKRAFAIFSIFSFIFFILVAAGVFYAFATHIAVVNLCPSNDTLILLPSGPSCYSNITNLVIVRGKAYTANSSVAISNGQAVPLQFSFSGGKPLFSIWNVNATESGNSYVFLTIPDTFKMHMQYTSSVRTEFLIFTNSQYLQWYNSGESSSSPNTYEYTGSSPSVWFNLSAGCAGYVAVIKPLSLQSFTIAPNETALYDPASAPTGVCS